MGWWSWSGCGTGRGRSRDRRIEAIRAGVAGALGMRSPPAVRTTHRLIGPVACGVVRPLILLPEDLLDSADDDRLRDVLIHESAHLVRFDPLVGLLQRVVGAVFWPHPMIHVLNHALTRAREEVCDNHVLRLGEPLRYARTLLDLAESRPVSRPALAAAGCCCRPAGGWPIVWRDFSTNGGTSWSMRIAGCCWADRPDVPGRRPLRRARDGPSRGPGEPAGPDGSS